MEICAALATQTGLAHVLGQCGLIFVLPAAGRSEEAVAIAEEVVAAARARDNPSWIAMAYLGYGRALTETDPTRALEILYRALAYSREHRLRIMEAATVCETAGLEAVHGDLDQALDLFTTSIDSFHRAGDTAGLAWTFASLAVFFDWIDRTEIAAAIYGTTTHQPDVDGVIGFVAALDHNQRTLDAETFEQRVQTGAAMNITDAVRSAHHHIDTIRQQQG